MGWHLQNYGKVLLNLKNFPSKNYLCYFLNIKDLIKTLILTFSHNPFIFAFIYVQYVFIIVLSHALVCFIYCTSTTNGFIMSLQYSLQLMKIQNVFINYPVCLDLISNFSSSLDLFNCSCLLARVNKLSS